ncbi:PREDICTED: protein IQ-DOMAIN 1-like [Nelumbo nucifera]|uniref:Protein IQ-DOMAIN 1-like n=1 Tax=Nelumbo nucifera TaxID=4432 RepID=A0A1U7ZHW4_NELNU|nr:PREDICTED: protein IQ-DOMAIN 1-like [Nelumbo nucifera]
MGLTGELVRSVFSKTTRSVSEHVSNGRSNGVDRRRWSSVRSYLCGDEFNSVLAEEDSASIKSSEATVTQPVAEDLKEEVETQSGVKEEQILDEKQNSSTKLLSEEDAAIFIQSAFRRFLARRRDRGTKQMDETEAVQGTKSPSKESVGTSIEVQTGNSVEVLSVREDRTAVQHQVQQKSRTQISKAKEDWDDSTVSSNISKLRIQNRQEAHTRRERALAYAFSQQLRICSKKKTARSDTGETNMGWNWLERWMATRQTDGSFVEDRMSRRLEPINNDQRSVLIKKNFDIGEEKESCGSNEVPDGIDSPTLSAEDRYKLVKNRLKATRSVSRRKTVPSYQYPSHLTKVSKKESSREAEKDKKQKQTQPRSVGEMKHKETSSQAKSVPPTSGSKWGH